MPTVNINSEDEGLQLIADLLHVMNNMRHAQKYWHVHFGAEAKNRKTRWEDRADKLLDKYGITDHNKINNIQVIKKDPS